MALLQLLPQKLNPRKALSVTPARKYSFRVMDCNFSVLLGKFRRSLQLQKKSLDVKSVCLKYQQLLQRLLMFPALVLPAWYRQHHWYNFLNMILLSIFHICSFYFVVTLSNRLVQCQRSQKASMSSHQRIIIGFWQQKKKVRYSD